jgi:uncharacterized protein (DUF924 family)
MVPFFLIKNSALQTGHQKEAVARRFGRFSKVERRLQKTSTELFATFLRKKSRKTYLFTFF